MEKVLSERGKELIIYQFYKFSYKELTKKGHKWRCAHKSCNSKLYIDEDKTTILSEEIKHDHPPPNNLERQIISNQVKRKAMDNLTEKPLKIISKEISNHVINNLKTDDISNIRQNLYRARRKNTPTLPTNLRETQEALINIPTLTNKDEEFLLINDSENKITAFSTMTNLKFLCCQEKIFMDGTFSYCPKYFYQLFTIHTVNNGNYIPLVFLLLPNKDTKIYERAFNSLIEVCTSKLSIHFQPKICIVDFEQSIHKAVLTVWPNIILRGCRFHLSQSWWRKIQNLGLSIEYKNHSSDIGKWLKWIFGLPLLEPENVGTCFVVDFMGIKPMDERIDKFCDYLVDTYIDENATFPPYLWSSCNISGERTTNACESFHSAFGKYFYSPHPNIFVFYEVLKMIQLQSYIKINSVEKENKIKNHKYKKQKTIADENISKYLNGNLDMFEFVKRISYHNKKF